MSLLSARTQVHSLLGHVDESNVGRHRDSLANGLHGNNCSLLARSTSANSYVLTPNYGDPCLTANVVRKPSTTVPNPCQFA